ncbi:MAG: hypothetical protein H5T97_04090 [Firmicutes bacterium]|nr:hypothetical protein [Bacillota bacterium]
MGGRGGERDGTERTFSEEREEDVRDGPACPECGRRQRIVGPTYGHRCPHCGYDYGIEYELH